MKIRIIPTILTDGVTVVKGEKFNNWRTVGNAQATARLYAARDVDELMFLDVNARAKGSYISKELVTYFSEVLDIPFSVGGGISSIEAARECMRYGAEKVVLGTSAVDNPSLISQVASDFGTQAVTVAVDVYDSKALSIRTNSGRDEALSKAYEFIMLAVKYGAGEILLQNIHRDGTLAGFDDEPLRAISGEVDVPIIASGGIANALDIQSAVNAGASAVSIGALFQFTQNTPASIASEVGQLGIPVRSRY
jgi:cyclase